MANFNPVIVSSCYSKIMDNLQALLKLQSLISISSNTIVRPDVALDPSFLQFEGPRRWRSEEGDVRPSVRPPRKKIFKGLSLPSFDLGAAAPSPDRPTDRTEQTYVRGLRGTRSTSNSAGCKHSSQLLCTYSYVGLLASAPKASS